MKNLLFLGLVLVFVGIILIFISSFYFAKDEANVRGAGGIFIGPFPIFGVFSDKKMFYLLLGIAFIIFILWLIFRRF